MDILRICSRTVPDAHCSDANSGFTDSNGMDARPDVGSARNCADSTAPTSHAAEY